MLVVTEADMMKVENKAEERKRRVVVAVGVEMMVMSEDMEKSAVGLGNWPYPV